MIIVNLDVMLAKRKMRSNELAEKVGLTQANLSILKSRSKAGEELRKLEHDPSTGITSRGERSQKVYVLRDK